MNQHVYPEVKVNLEKKAIYSQVFHLYHRCQDLQVRPKTILITNFNLLLIVLIYNSVYSSTKSVLRLNQTDRPQLYTGIKFYLQYHQESLLLLYHQPGQFDPIYHYNKIIALAQSFG